MTHDLARRFVRSTAIVVLLAGGASLAPELTGATGAAFARDGHDDHGHDDHGGDDHGGGGRGSDDRGGDDHGSRDGGADDSPGHDMGEDHGEHRGEHRGRTSGGTFADDDLTTVASLETSASGVEVRYTSGWREQIENGRYELKNPTGQTVEERPATEADHARILALR